jgi:hypothetical protein
MPVTLPYSSAKDLGYVRPPFYFRSVAHLKSNRG